MRIEDIDKEFQEINRSLKDAEKHFGEGNYPQAENLYKRALELVENCYGKEHGETTACLTRLAETYYAQHKFSELIPVYTRLWIQKENSLGASHPEVASLLFKLAKTYEKLGMLREAEQSYKKALSVDQLELKHSLLAASILESFSKMLKHVTGRFDEAKILDERSRDLRNKQTSEFKDNILKQLALSNQQDDSAKVETAELDSELKAIDEETTDFTGKSKIRNLRNYLADETIEKKPVAKQKKILLIAVPVFMSLLIVGMIFALNTKAGKSILATINNSINNSHQKTNVDTTPKAPPSITYKTLDDYEQVKVEENGKAIAMMRGNTINGNWTIVDKTISIKYDSGKKKLVFSQLDDRLTNSQGKTYYGPDCLELKLVPIMREYATFAQKYYQKNNVYPKAFPQYKNPFSGQMQGPIKTDLLPIQPLAMTLNEFSVREDTINQLRNWDSASRQIPGAIEIHHFPAGPEGDAIYIRASDRSGTLLRGSDPSKAFVIQVNQAYIKS
jgi:tetratricopeptide (TPR) repeat protein